MNILYRNAIIMHLAILAVSLPMSSANSQQRGTTDETITFFYYEDVASVAFFYEDLLDLEKTMDQDWVKIYRITPTSYVGLVQQSRGFHEVSASKPAMLSIVTDDVDAWYRLLRDAGVVILREPPEKNGEAGADGAPVRGFIAEDPGGYTIEFFSWLTTP